jgi:hypothetical protein
LALAWIVEDWRTGIPLVRHRVQEVSYENVTLYYDYHNGRDNAKETIIDSEYNTKFVVTWNKEAD